MKALKIVGVLVLLYLIVAAYQMHQRFVSDDPKYVALRQVKIEQFSWRPGGFSTVLIADFKINNPTPHGLKDFVVSCTIYGRSGTAIATNSRTVYEVVSPKSVRAVKGLNMGLIDSQSTNASCEITDLSLAD